MNGTACQYFCVWHRRLSMRRPASLERRHLAAVVVAEKTLWLREPCFIRRAVPWLSFFRGPHNI